MFITQKNTELTQVIAYSPPRLYTGKDWYVGWYSYDPILQKQRRKKIKLNHILNNSKIIADLNRICLSLIQKQENTDPIF